MKKPEIWRIVFGFLTTKKDDITIENWDRHIREHLVPEIREERMRYYGDNTSVESRHSGLDYASKGHRLRLGTFPKHRQLFLIFDTLRLTDHEIRALCRWEGTLLAKRYYERQKKIRINDTTWECVLRYTKPKPTAYVLPPRLPQRATMPSELGTDPSDIMGDEESRALDKGEGESAQEISEEAHRRHGPDLNQRLLNGNVDADWEQWMKEALERGDVQSLLESHLQTPQDLARLSNQIQVPPHAHRDSPSMAPSRSSSLTSSHVDSEHPQQNIPTGPSHDDILVTQPHRPSLFQPTLPRDQLHQISSYPGLNAPHSQTFDRLTPQLSEGQGSLLQEPITLSQLLDHGNTARGPFLQRDHPVELDSYPRSLGALPNSSQPAPYNNFYPSARVVSSPAGGLDPVVLSATPSTSVPS